MEWIAVISRLIVANIIFSLLFVPLMRRLADRDRFERTFFGVWVISLIPTLVASDLLSRIPTAGPYLGFALWAALSPLFAEGPLGRAIAGAAIFFVLVLGVSYGYYRLVTAVIKLRHKNLLGRSLILVGAYWLALVTVIAVLGWLKVPSPAQSGFAAFMDHLAGLVPARRAQVASGRPSGLVRGIDIVVISLFGLWILGCVGNFFSQEPASEQQVTHGDIVAILLGTSLVWCWLYAFAIRNFALHSGIALVAGLMFVPIGNSLNRSAMRARPGRTLANLLFLAALFAGSVVLVYRWEFLHRNLSLALVTWSLIPHAVYLQYGLWGLTALVAFLHIISLVRQMPAARRQWRFRPGWAILSLLAAATGAAAALALQQSGRGIALAVVAGCFVADTLYNWVVSPLLASSRGPQAVAYILPRLVLPLPLFVPAVLLLHNLTWAAAAAYGALLLLELGWRWLLRRLAPILSLRVQVARAELWGNYGRARQQSQALRQALLKRWQETVRQADKLRTAGRTAGAQRRYNRVIRAVSRLDRREKDEQQVLARALLGLGKVQWATDPQASLRAFQQARELGVTDTEVHRLVAPAWAGQNRTDDEAIEAYMLYVEAGLGRGRPDDDAAVLRCLQAACLIEDATQGPNLLRAMQRNERVTRAADNVDWAHAHLGLGFLTQGKPAEALAHLERVQVLRPDWKETLYHLGRAYLLAGRTDEALDALRQARAALPDHAPTAHLLGTAMLDQLLASDPEPDLSQAPVRRTWSEAVRNLEMAVAARRPAPAGYSYQLGRAYSLLPAMRDSAVVALRDAVAADGAQKQYHWRLGLELKNLGQLDGAKRAAEAALKLDPTYAEARLLLGEVLLAQGEPAQARAHFEPAAKALGTTDAIAAGLGQALFQLGEHQRAAELLQGVRRPTAASLFYLARAQAHMDRFDDAARCLVRRLEQFGEEAEARYYLGCARAHLGKYPEALADLDQAVAQAPDQGDPWVQRGHVLLTLGREEEARESYRRAIAADAEHVEAHYALGRYHQSRQEWQEAAARYEQVVAIAPAHAPAQRALGFLCEQGGDAKAAMTHYEASLEADEPCAWVHHRLGVLDCAQPLRSAHAVEQLRRARELGDSSARLGFYLGLACLKQGDYAAAVAEWEGLLGTEPDDSRLQTNLAAAYYLWGQQAFASGEYRTAIERWERFRAQFSTNRKIQLALAEAHFRVGVAQLVRGGQATEARQALEAAIALQGDGGLARQRLYLALALLGTDGAGPELERAVELLAGIDAAEPEHAAARYWRALALWNRYQVRRDEADLDQATDLLYEANEEGRPQPGPAPLLLALALSDRGRHAAAGEVLLQAWPLLAEGSGPVPAREVARLLAWNLERAMGPERAAAALRELRASSDHPALTWCLAAWEAQAGRLDQAAALLQQSVQEGGDGESHDGLVQLRCHQAALRGKEGDWLGAAELLRQAVTL